MSDAAWRYRSSGLWWPSSPRNSTFTRRGVAVEGSATGVAGAPGLAWLAASFFVVYLCARLLTLGWRVRGTAWQRVGAR